MQDVPNRVPNDNVIELFEKLKQTNMHKYVGLLNMPEHYIWGTPAFITDTVIDQEGITIDNSGRCRLTDHSGTLFVSSEESTFFRVASKVYFHPYWRLQARRYRFWSSDSDRCFSGRFSKAVRKLFGHHPEREHVFSMACRSPRAECPDESTLLYVMSTLGLADDGYIAHGQFRDRMRHYELRLQAESMLGSRKVRNSLLSDKELQDAGQRLYIDWLPTDENLTGLHPSYKKIAAEQLDEPSNEEDEEDRDSSNVQVRPLARILQLLIEGDENLSVLSDANLLDTFDLLISQMTGKKNGNISPAAKLAARLVEMHVQADDCLSHLTDKDRKAIFTVLLDRYTDDE